MDLPLWGGWGQLAGAVVATALTYAFTIVAVRVAGRRTIAQMNALDVVVTVALGTIAASTALPRDATLADGAAVLVTFLLLQTLIGAIRQRWPRFRRWVDFQPKAIVVDGEPDLRSAPWTAQLTVTDLESRLRQNGVGDLSDVRVAILEPTGNLTVSSGEGLPELFRHAKK